MFNATNKQLVRMVEISTKVQVSPAGHSNVRFSTYLFLFYMTW